jgi:DNA polymerase
VENISEILSQIENHLRLYRSLSSRFLITHKDTSDSEVALKNLFDEVSNCTKCTLYKTRTKAVFGSGSPRAKLLFIGEAPGYYEDVQGLPFVGEAGQLLTKIIASINLTRKEVYIANVLKCRPPGNRSPIPDEIISCYPFLVRQISAIHPAVICVLGSIAAKALMKTSRPMNQIRGEFQKFGDIAVMPTFHPAYLLRNPSDKRKVWEDMQKIRDYLATV